MNKRLFYPYGIWQDGGIALVRITVGLLMTYHGWEVFDQEKMTGYGKWLTDLHFFSPVLMAYLGKGTELVTGILLTLGLFTRLAVIPLAITMLSIIFGMGKGRILMEDQHPFLFVLLALVFFFTGPGKWSLDGLMYRKSQGNYSRREKV
jgi:putative oxidoreductase